MRVGVRRIKARQKRQANDFLVPSEHGQCPLNDTQSLSQILEIGIPPCKVKQIKYPLGLLIVKTHSQIKTTNEKLQ